MSTLSARVLSPAVMSELRLRPGSTGRTGVRTLEGVRRNLFGSIDPEESRRFADKEMAKKLDADSQRWEFDFANERPLPGGQRFTWKLVPASSVPLSLRRFPIRPVRVSPPGSPPTTNLILTHMPMELDENSPVKRITPDRTPELARTQKRITDFLKPCKRLANGSAKKSPMSSPGSAYRNHGSHGAIIRPPKVARIGQMQSSNRITPIENPASALNSENTPKWHR